MEMTDQDCEFSRGRIGSLLNNARSAASCGPTDLLPQPSTHDTEKWTAYSLLRGRRLFSETPAIEPSTRRLRSRLTSSRKAGAPMTKRLAAGARKPSFRAATHRGGLAFPNPIRIIYGIPIGIGSGPSGLGL